MTNKTTNKFSPEVRSRAVHIMFKLAGLLFACAVVTGVSSACADPLNRVTITAVGALESYAAAPRRVIRAAPRPVTRAAPRQ
jgi:hypothetical protein